HFLTFSHPLLLHFSISAATKFQMEISCPDLTTHIMDDPFKNLGPLSFFSAKRQWTQPRHVTLHRRGGGFGLSVKGSAPVVIASVEEDGSPAEVRKWELVISMMNFCQFMTMTHEFVFVTRWA